MGLDNEAIEILAISLTVSVVCAIFLVCIFMIPFWCKAGTCSKCSLPSTPLRATRRLHGYTAVSPRDLEEQAPPQYHEKEPFLTSM